MKIKQLFLVTISLFAYLQAYSQNFTISSTDASAYPLIRSHIQMAAGTTAQGTDFTVVEEGKEVNSTLKDAPDSATSTGTGKAVMLLIEASGFTYGTGVNNFKTAVVEALSGLRSGDKVNIGYFGKVNKNGKTLNVLSPAFTTDVTQMKNEITSKVTASRDTTYKADVYKAIYEALDFITEKKDLPANKQLIVMSAAINNSRSPIKAEDCIEKSQRLKIPIYTITYKTGNLYAPDNFVRLSDRTNGETTLAKTLGEIRTATRDFITLPPAKPASAGAYILEFTTANPQNGRIFQYEVRYKGQRQAATYKAPQSEGGFMSNYGLYLFLMVALIASGMGWFLYRAKAKKAAYETTKFTEQETRLRDAVTKERSVQQEIDRQPEVKSYNKPIAPAPPKDLKRTMIAGGGTTPVLMVSSGAFSQNFTLDRPQLTIGRATGNDIVIPESTVSGKHATLTNENGHFYLSDLGSTNGTFINTVRLQGKQLLKPGDLIQMGAAQMRFQV